MENNSVYTRGFKNPSVFCYANSSIQLLFHSPTFCEWLKKVNLIHGAECQKMADSCTLCQLVKLYCEYFGGNRQKPLSVFDLLSAMQHSAWSGLHLSRMQCASELLDVIIAHLQENYGLLDFNLKLISRKTCLSCDAVTIANEGSSETCIRVWMQGNESLLEAINAKLERTDRTKLEKCSSCQRIVLHHTDERFIQLPNVLVVHLENEWIPYTGYRAAKVQNRISLPYVGADGLEEGFQNYTLKSFIYFVNKDNAKLDRSQGHYFNVSKEPDGYFYKFDDLEVTRVTNLEEVAFGAPAVAVYDIVHQTKSLESGSASKQLVLASKNFEFQLDAASLTRFKIEVEDTRSIADTPVKMSPHHLTMPQINAYSAALNPSKYFQSYRPPNTVDYQPKTSVIDPYNEEAGNIPDSLVFDVSLPDFESELTTNSAAGPAFQMQTEPTFASLQQVFSIHDLPPNMRAEVEAQFQSDSCKMLNVLKDPSNIFTENQAQKTVANRSADIQPSIAASTLETNDAFSLTLLKDDEETAEDSANNESDRRQLEESRDAGATSTIASSPEISLALSYAESGIHLLFHSNVFCQWMREISSHHLKECAGAESDCVFCQLWKLYTSYEAKEWIINVNPLITAMKKHEAKRIDQPQSHCVDEFLDILISLLRSGFGLTEFQFELLKLEICPNCKKESFTEKTISDHCIRLVIQRPVSLLWAVETKFNCTNDCYVTYCRTCKESKPHTLKTRFTKLPNILLVFVDNVWNATAKKCFPYKLKAHLTLENLTIKEVTNQSQKYKLKGVVFHVDFDTNGIDRGKGYFYAVCQTNKYGDFYKFDNAKPLDKIIDVRDVLVSAPAIALYEIFTEAVPEPLTSKCAPTTDNKHKGDAENDGSSTRLSSQVKSRQVSQLTMNLRKRKFASNIKSDNTPDYGNGDRQCSSSSSTSKNAFLVENISDIDISIHENLQGKSVSKPKKSKLSCYRCQRLCDSKNQLYWHQKKCKVPYKFNCNYCSDSFDAHDKLRIHVIEDHTLNRLDETRENAITRADMFKYVSIKIVSECMDCDAVFDSTKGLYNHRLIAHPGPKNYEKLDNGQTKCNFCQHVFASITTVKKHIKRLHSNNVPKRYFCRFCGLSCQNAHYFRIHCCPKDLKSLQCPICPLQYGTQGLLDQHLSYHQRREEMRERNYN